MYVWYLDVSKAFNRINHFKLHRKLLALNVTTTIAVQLIYMVYSVQWGIYCQVALLCLTVYNSVVFCPQFCLVFIEKSGLYNNPELNVNANVNNYLFLILYMPQEKRENCHKVQ